MLFPIEFKELETGRIDRKKDRKRKRTQNIYSHSVNPNRFNRGSRGTRGSRPPSLKPSHKTVIEMN